MFKLLFYSLKQAFAKGLKPGTAELLRASFVSFSAQSIYSPSQNTGRRGSCCLTDKEACHSTSFQRFCCGSSFRLSQGNGVLNTTCRQDTKLPPCWAAWVAALCTGSLELHGQLCGAASLWKTPPFSVPSKGFSLKMMVIIISWQLKKRCTKRFPGKTEISLLLSDKYLRTIKI